MTDDARTRLRDKIADRLVNFERSKWDLSPLAFVDLNASEQAAYRGKADAILALPDLAALLAPPPAVDGDWDGRCLSCQGLLPRHADGCVGYAAGLALLAAAPTPPAASFLPECERCKKPSPHGIRCYDCLVGEVKQLRFEADRCAAQSDDVTPIDRETLAHSLFLMAGQHDDGDAPDPKGDPSVRDLCLLAARALRSPAASPPAPSALVEALKLARNRLQRAAVSLGVAGDPLAHDCDIWASEAEASALAHHSAQPASEGETK